MKHLAVAMYARVSSDQQAHAQTIDSQVAALRARVTADECMVLPEGEFTDEGYSGATLIRPGLERLRDLCASGGVERLYVLPTLAPVAASSETLAGLGTRRLLNELKDRDSGRLLIVDLPPVLLSDDALMLAPLLDAVVLVVNERKTRREDVARVIELLGTTRIIGTVLNRSSESEKRAY